jgi:hypothetical protein
MHYCNTIINKYKGRWQQQHRQFVAHQLRGVSNWITELHINSRDFH